MGKVDVQILAAAALMLSIPTLGVVLQSCSGDGPEQPSAVPAGSEDAVPKNPNSDQASGANDTDTQGDSENSGGLSAQPKVDDAAPLDVNLADGGEFCREGGPASLTGVIPEEPLSDSIPTPTGGQVPPGEYSLSRVVTYADSSQDHSARYFYLSLDASGKGKYVRKLFSSVIETDVDWVVEGTTLYLNATCPASEAGQTYSFQYTYALGELVLVESGVQLVLE